MAKTVETVAINPPHLSLTSLKRGVNPLLLTTCCLLLAASAFSQKSKKIELLHADVLEYDESKGTKAKRLIGKVAFKHEGVLMYCDSAYLYSEQNNMDAYGHVRIMPDEKTTIYGDSLNYNGNTRVAQLRGEIRMVEENKTLTTTYLDYNLKTDLAYYLGGGKLVNKEENSTLTSAIGYYYPKSKEFFFKDSVVLVHPDYTINSDTLMHNTETEITHFYGPSTIKTKENFIYCENGWFDSKNELMQFSENAWLENKNQKLSGDSIYYNQGKGIGEVFGNVTVIDTTEDMIINGDYSIHYEKDSVSLVTGHTLLTQFFKDDTLYLHADTLLLMYDTTRQHRMMYAYYKVKFYKSDMQGKSDSLVFSNADSTIKMYHNPVIWSKENQMTADYIELFTYDGKVESMKFDENSFIASEEICPAPCFGDTLKYNQIKGKDMLGYFKDNELYKIDVLNKGQTIYYAKEDNGDIIGMNRSDGDKIAVYVKDRSVHKIAFLTTTKAILYPLEEVKKDDVFLSGFNWQAAARPLKMEDIFVWESP